MEENSSSLVEAIERPDETTAEVSVEITKGVRSLRDLIERVTGKGLVAPEVQEDAGLAEVIPFPFLAIVNQYEMKMALILALINPAVGGVLLIGPRGTGKTTAVRGLLDLLPLVPRSLCYYGCLPEDIETMGIDAVCPDCARKYAEGKPLAVMDRARLVELPLNARLEDVIGGIDERAAIHHRLRLQRGILSQADRNVLYVDEVNLLDDEIINALLDAAAQGNYTVRRGPISATYRSRFILVGSMNPEEGYLRPQIQDRFGLRVIVKGLEDDNERLEAYRRVKAYLANPRLTAAQFRAETEIAREELQLARELLPKVELPDRVAKVGLRWIKELGIESLRAEITLFEAARAFAAADSRQTVEISDLKQVAPMALRLRRSSFMSDYLDHQEKEQAQIRAIIEAT
ncbi:MAG: ATP-binding protein [Anaerolineales bacterium]|nr:ATP-binding protein [Anaerolineales bacterium]MCS7246827.1 ATP-binding protein [Anaerolineales bacterium]MDW8160637.1 ATP-binding protein [Anaerolineales bacterium]MDW8446112.1 ATP-binding protein [Anaerolineales bacterium]